MQEVGGAHRAALTNELAPGAGADVAGRGAGREYNTPRLNAEEATTEAFEVLDSQLQTLQTHRYLRTLYITWTTRCGKALC